MTEPLKLVEQNPKEKLQSAVTKVGRAFDELVGVVEKHGAGLNEELLLKTFAFLGEVAASADQKARLSLKLAIAANGAFSLDDYQLPSTRPEPLEFQSPAQREAALPAMDPALAALNGVVLGEDGKPEGRIAGSRPKRRKRDPLNNPEASEFFDDE